MKVTFFGSSHGFPEPNRKCSCILLEAGDRKYLIDAGTNPMDPLTDRGYTPDVITAIFITHMHGDHTHGLIPFLDLCSWYYKTANPVTYLPDLRAREAIDNWMDITGTHLRPELLFRAVEEGLFYDDGVIRVTALRTGHTDQSFAFIVEAEGKKVLFTGDMKVYTGVEEDYARFVKGQTFDLVVAEGAHFSALLYEPFIRSDPPKRFCMNHYSIIMADTVYALRTKVKDLLPFYLATDGLEISF